MGSNGENMKVTVVGKGDQELTSKDYITQGGEGKIYVKKGIVYKIHDDPSKMIPLDKIDELKKLNLPNIIRPENVVLKGNKPVGYTMKYIPDSFSLCQLFTKAFKKRHNLNETNINDLVKIMQSTINFIHNKDVLIVDLNEMNFLVDTKFDEVFFIDVNSYQTKKHPATAIMESIRDRHCNGIFSKMTDWFSFGIVSFQMFVGIHPYKGKHTLSSLDERMKKNISVFNKDVSLPPVCYPLDVIPVSLRNWYESIFEKGERTQPPADFTAVNHLVQHVPYVTTGNKLEVVLIKSFDEEILCFAKSFDKEVVITDKGFVYCNSVFHKLPSIKNAQIGFTPKMNSPIVAYLDNNSVKLFDVMENKELPYTANGSDIMSYNGKIYYQNGDQIIEVQFTEIKNITIPTSKVVGTILERSAKMYDGVIIQSMLAGNDTQTYFASIFPEAGLCYQFFIPEVGEYRILNAKYQNKVLMLIGLNNKTGKYDHFILKLDDGFKKYETIKEEDVDLTDLNFVVNNAGIAVFIKDGKLNIFSNKIGANQVRVIDEPIAVKQDIKLYTNGEKIFFTKGSDLHSVRVKS